ncbi:MAG: glycosyltransferase [Candidatus Nanopelagicales bacterium]|nr:glycosyltransferase [Candidatus Nanopelagicales bacterium]
MEPAQHGLRARAGQLASRVVPDLDERAWRRARRRQVAQLRAEGAGLDASVTRGASVIGRAPHIVVVPMDGPGRDTWRPAGGNFFYEIQQAAREHLPGATVSIVSVEEGEPASSWHRRVAQAVIDLGATHVIAQVETDPERAGQWTWDVLWADLAEIWDGVLLGVVFDSAFRMITLQCRELARISDRFLLVDICMPMDGLLVRGRPEVGPVNMPVSRASLDVIDARIHDLPKHYDVSFIGALYPYRVELIDRIRASGVSIAVNPHRQDAATDLASSRRAQPSYIDYMAAIAQSRMTINFSESSAGTLQQLKTRVLEATAVGCFVLTDDVDRTSRFWPADEYGYFADPDELPALVARLLADPQALEAATQRAMARARAINASSFWGGIEEGLRRRSLAPLS